MPREAAAQAARGPSEPTVAREERRDRLSPRFSRVRKRIVRQLREGERLTAASSSSSWSRIFQSRANVSCTISQASA